MPQIASFNAAAVREQISDDPPVDPAVAALSHEIGSLQTLDIHALRTCWRQRLRSTPPTTLTRPLLLRLLAYKVQARVLGDLDPATAKVLDRVARDHARRRDRGEPKVPKAVPPVPPVPREHGLKPGTLLVREHAGALHKVIVTAQGFSWQGRAYTSLSEIAHGITGTRWNGPRFFGLRDKALADKALADKAVAEKAAADTRKGGSTP